MAPPPELLEDLVEEALIRCPPDDPARLVRAALVCKQWCRVVSGAGFRRRYRQLHGSPPVLGFFHLRDDATHFMPTTSFRPRPATLPTIRDWHLMDARHGRALFREAVSSHCLHVSNPITGESRKLPTLLLPSTPANLTAALLCTTDGCDHLDCPSGPFMVVRLVTDGFMNTTARVYSSETATWSETASNAVHPQFPLFSGTLAGDALYYLLSGTARILGYDVGKHELSVVRLPSKCYAHCLTSEDGALGFATMQDEKLHMWSREACQNGWEWC
ncbi:hypothetical protein ACP70R_014625 [Stipagrostis hirtigluma subsp. patula]